MSQKNSKRPLRIAHVTATFPPYQGGTGNVCYYQARELARLGHHVSVFTSSQFGAPLNENVQGFFVYRIRPVLRIGNASILLRLLSLLRGYDLIHLHCPFITGAELTYLASIFHRTPLVVTYHSDLIQPGGWRDSFFAVATKSSQFVLQRADCVLFVSEGHAKTCEQRAIYFNTPDHCHILPNGIDTELFRPGSNHDAVRLQLGIPDRASLVGFVAALDRAHHYKGLDVLLESMSSEKLADAYVVVVGDGDMRSHYEQSAIKLGLDERVLFWGGVDQKQLPPIYRACDVVVMPSKKPESFGLVAAEAMACGIPVVVANFPGVRSLVREGENGFLFKPGDESDLSMKLFSILSQPDDKRRTMGLIGRRKVVASYDWRRIGEQLDNIYAEVMAEYQQDGRTSRTARIVQ